MHKECSPLTKRFLTFDANFVALDNQLRVVMLGRALDVQMDANRHLLGHVAPADEMHGEAFDRHRDDAAGRNVQLGMLQRSLVVIVVYRYRVRKLAKKKKKRTIRYR